jgi:Ca-activated chloride channel homolog
MIACEVITMRALRLPLAMALAIAAVFGQQVSIEPRSRLSVQQKPVEAREDPGNARLRIDTSLVLVPVEVSDRLNRPVSGLEKQNFHVFDDKVEQKIVSFAMEDDPIAVGLVFDISGSMGGDLPQMRHAASQFFKTSNPGDEFCLVELASTAQVAVPLTQNAADVDYKLMFSKGGGSTALLDGVYLGLNEVRKSKNLRKALVIISDGGDNNSRYTSTQIADLVREADVQIYAMGVFEPTLSFGLSGGKLGSAELDGPRLLSAIADQTGGRALAASTLRELPGIAERIGIELRNQYVLAYTPQNHGRDGKYRKIEVKVAQPKALPALKARWRLGYYAPSE